MNSMKIGKTRVKHPYFPLSPFRSPSFRISVGTNPCALSPTVDSTYVRVNRGVEKAKSPDVKSNFTESISSVNGGKETTDGNDPGAVARHSEQPCWLWDGDKVLYASWANGPSIGTSSSSSCVFIRTKNGNEKGLGVF